jgi:hypothetical protein
MLRASTAARRPTPQADGCSFAFSTTLQRRRHRRDKRRKGSDV